MEKVGIIFGTDTGYTRRIAKMIAKELGSDKAEKPINVNRISVEEFLSYDKLIIGTPTYGEGALPGIDTGIQNGSWAEFIENLEDNSLQGMTIALYGFGDQIKYPNSYVAAMGKLYEVFKGQGARFVGSWPTEGYQFDTTEAVVDGRFVGLALDEKNQSMLTKERVQAWLEQIKVEFL